MKRLHSVHGTKERPIGRRCITFSHAHHGPVIIDRVHPDDRGEMFARLWALYGRGNVWQQSRRMKPGEVYTELEFDQVAS